MREMMPLKFEFEEPTPAQPDLFTPVPVVDITEDITRPVIDMTADLALFKASIQTTDVLDSLWVESMGRLTKGREYLLEQYSGAMMRPILEALINLPAGDEHEAGIAQRLIKIMPKQAKNIALYLELKAKVTALGARLLDESLLAAEIEDRVAVARSPQRRWYCED
jgi:hypothetical protein